MTTSVIKKLAEDLKSGRISPNKYLRLAKTQPNRASKTRPNSISVEDAFFGDSGKGAVVAKLVDILNKKNHVYSLRFNGGSNAGHEAIVNGHKITTHQLPIATTITNTTSFMLRGMVIHPQDLIYEIELVKKIFGIKNLPGKLLIDHNTPLCLNTHRAMETITNQVIKGARGSTGRGIAPAYMDFYARSSLTIRDLLRKNWEDLFSKHYDFYEMLLMGFGTKLKDICIYTMEQNDKQKLGSKKNFLLQLQETRRDIAEYSSFDIVSLLKEAWIKKTSPFIIESAQGAGLDPYHGVYPDVTASRPMSRNINDSTYNIILPEEINIRAAVLKTTYMSSVGIRKLPLKKDSAYKKYEQRIQKDFDEKGRSTGRLRDIYPISIPIARFLKRASGYNTIIPTHLDASQRKDNISVVIEYKNRINKKPQPYSPYQEDLNKLETVSTSFKGWDSKTVITAGSVKNLPEETRIYLAFLSAVIAPIVFSTHGQGEDDYLNWMQ